MSSYYSSSERSLEDIIESERQDIGEYVQNRRHAIYKLVKALRSVVSIDRYRIGGSLGKGTSLGPSYNPDVDINLFINGAAPNNSDNALESFLKNARNEISTYLKNECSHLCKVIYSGPAYVAVGVHVYSIKTNVDLIPGINFGSRGNLQYETTLDRIVDANTNLSWANVCYAEESVRFFASRNEFALNVVRAAKYWNHHCVKMAPLSGRSVIVETVALKAAQDELNRWEDQSTLNDALERFFKYMEQPCNRIRIVVAYDEVEDWPQEARRKVNSWGRGPAGYVVDPVNPYRNFLADPKVKENWYRFQNAAKSSIQDLNAGDSAEAIGF